MYKWLFVGMGGFIGSVLRFFISSAVSRFLGHHKLPWGTITVNIIGCFLIGFLEGVFEIKNIMSHELRLFLFLGVLGGFTTFSTFQMESFSLLRSNLPFWTLGNLAVSIILGLAAVWIGSQSARLL